MTRRADGKYVVKLTVASTKLRSDGLGEPKPVPNSDLIRIAVLTAHRVRRLLRLRRSPG